MLANAKAGAWYTIGAQYAAMDKRWIVAGDAECLLPLGLSSLICKMLMISMSITCG